MSHSSAEQENSTAQRHANPNQSHTHHSSSSPSKQHKQSHSTKLPLSPIHYHPNIPPQPTTRTTHKPTSPARERPQLRRRRTPMADSSATESGYTDKVRTGQHARMSSVDRATEVLSQLHFDYSKAKTSGGEHSDRSDRTLEQRYEQWKQFWQTIDPAHTSEQNTRTAHESLSSATDVDTERLLRWLAFSRQHAHSGKQTEDAGSGDAQPASDSSPASSSSSTRSTSPHSPTYYVNLARFLSTAQPHRLPLRPRPHKPTAPPRAARPQKQRQEQPAQPTSEADELTDTEERRSSECDAEPTERVEIVIDNSDDQHVAHRYIHKPPTVSAHRRPTTDAPHLSNTPPDATMPSSATSFSASASAPSRPSSTYSFTNLPSERVRPAASTSASDAASGGSTSSSFGLHSYFARMTVVQLQRYLRVFNPSLLGSSLTLTKDQLIAACCTFYRTHIASQAAVASDASIAQAKQDAARDAIVAHTSRSYAHLPLAALLHTITAATTLASPPRVLSGVGYEDERSVKSGYRRCMLRVHPDKHTLSGWEEQTRCLELFRLVQDKYAQWQRTKQ